MRTRRYEVSSADGCRVGVVSEVLEDGREAVVQILNFADQLTEIKVVRPDGAVVIQHMLHPGWPHGLPGTGMIEPPNWFADPNSGIVGEVAIALKPFPFR